mmetsp:Transcript_75944/g.210862  ORF Transcript_75944/g.210862 Transcript_75944/m.210862 type:complete len:313 (-) Transcript_75944:160-1098(-)
MHKPLSLDPMTAVVGRYGKRFNSFNACRSCACVRDTKKSCGARPVSIRRRRCHANAAHNMAAVLPVPVGLSKSACRPVSSASMARSMTCRCGNIGPAANGNKTSVPRMLTACFTTPSRTGWGSPGRADSRSGGSLALSARSPQQRRPRCAASVSTGDKWPVSLQAALPPRCERKVPATLGVHASWIFDRWPTGTKPPLSGSLNDVVSATRLPRSKKPVGCPIVGCPSSAPAAADDHASEVFLSHAGSTPPKSKDSVCTLRTGSLPSPSASCRHLSSTARSLFCSVSWPHAFASNNGTASNCNAASRNAWSSS